MSRKRSYSQSSGTSGNRVSRVPSTQLDVGQIERELLSRDQNEGPRDQHPGTTDSLFKQRNVLRRTSARLADLYTRQSLTRTQAVPATRRSKSCDRTKHHQRLSRKSRTGAKRHNGWMQVRGHHGTAEAHLVSSSKNVIEDIEGSICASNIPSTISCQTPPTLNDIHCNKDCQYSRASLSDIPVLSVSRNAWSGQHSRTFLRDPYLPSTSNDVTVNTTWSSRFERQLNQDNNAIRQSRVSKQDKGGTHIIKLPVHSVLKIQPKPATSSTWTRQRSLSSFCRNHWSRGSRENIGENSRHNRSFSANSGVSSRRRPGSHSKKRVIFSQKKQRTTPLSSRYRVTPCPTDHACSESKSCSWLSWLSGRTSTMYGEPPSSRASSARVRMKTRSSPGNSLTTESLVGSLIESVTSVSALPSARASSTGMYNGHGKSRNGKYTNRGRSRSGKYKSPGRSRSAKYESRNRSRSRGRSTQRRRQRPQGARRTRSTGSRSRSTRHRSTGVSKSFMEKLRGYWGKPENSAAGKKRKRDTHTGARSRSVSRAKGQGRKDKKSKNEAKEEDSSLLCLIM